MAEHDDYRKSQNKAPGAILSTTASLAEHLVSLMPGGDDQRMWRSYLASALEQVAATDDISLLRAAKGADEFEVGFMDFVSNFPGVEIEPAPEGGFTALRWVL